MGERMLKFQIGLKRANFLLDNQTFDVGQKSTRDSKDYDV